MRFLMWVVVVGLFGACGADDTEKLRDDGSGAAMVFLPELEASVAELMFDASATGETVVQGVDLRNVGPGLLVLQRAEVERPAGLDTFALVEDFENLHIEPEAAARIEVAFTRPDDRAYEGALVLYTNDHRLPDGVARIALRAPAATGGLVAEPAEVVFAEHALPDTWELVAVRNVGSRPVEVDEIFLRPSDAPFRVTFPARAGTGPELDADPPVELAPEEEMLLRVWLGAGATFEVATLYVEPRDPNIARLEIPVRRGATPCLEVSPNAVEFTTGLGYSRTAEVRLTNCSRLLPLEVTEITVCDGDDQPCVPANAFSVSDASLTLGPGPGMAEVVEVTFDPPALGEYRGRLRVVPAEDAIAPVEVALVGTATELTGDCPQAVAKAQLAGSGRWVTDISTVPLQTIQFSAEDSIDLDGTLQRYEWTVVQRPNGSTASMTPSAAVSTPSLFLDLSGDYLVRLTVYDDDGNPSCGEDALITIRATPDGDVYVQLVWDTPADNDQTDAFGTDLDLHFLHPNGSWNNPPYDVYWLNPTSDWGIPGPGDDPSLDIDDTDGAGPESVSMMDPTAGLNYAVGVYYYADEGYGPSYATVRVHIRGTQAYEHRDMFMASTGTFWYAAVIEWPTGAVNGVNVVQAGFPNQN